MCLDARPVPPTRGSDRSTRPLSRHRLRAASTQTSGRDVAFGVRYMHPLAWALRQNCVALDAPVTIEAGRLIGVRGETVDPGERAALGAWQGNHEDGINQASQSRPAVHILEAWRRRNTPGGLGTGLLPCWPTGGNSRVPRSMYLPAGVWCHRDLDQWYQYNPPTDSSRLAPLLQPGGSRQPAHDVRLLLFPVPVICLCSPRIISFQCQSHCLSCHSGHRTLMYNLSSNVFSLRTLLLALGCRTPAHPQDQVVAWRCSLHGDCAPLQS